MPTWVVPSIAADLWRVPLDNVLSQIQSGSIPAKFEEGFTFVDVDPYGSAPRARPTPRENRPSTYREVTSEELRALCAEPTPAETQSKWEETHWRDARRIVQRKRIPPPR